MRFLIALFLLWSSAARAEHFFGFGTGLRFTGSSSGVGQDFIPVQAAVAGLFWGDWGAMLEACEARRESGGGGILVSVRETDAVIWGRRILARQYWNPFLAAGAGLQSSQVDTHLSGTVTSNRGEPTVVSGLALGIQSRALQSVNFGFEIRWLNGSQLRAATSYESISRLVYQF